MERARPNQVVALLAQHDAAALDQPLHADLGLSVSTDALVFNEDERGPADDQLRLHLEALNHLDDDEKTTVINLIESVLLRHQARRLARSS